MFQKSFRLQKMALTLLLILIAVFIFFLYHTVPKAFAGDMVFTMLSSFLGLSVFASLGYLYSEVRLDDQFVRFQFFGRWKSIAIAELSLVQRCVSGQGSPYFVFINKNGRMTLKITDYYQLERDLRALLSAHRVPIEDIWMSYYTSKLLKKIRGFLR